MEVPCTLVDASGAAADLVVAWEGPVLLAEVLEEAGVALPYPGAAVWVDGRTASPDQPVERAGLRPGSVVSLRADVADRTRAGYPAGAPHLAVVAGPAAGLVVPLGSGRHLLGRGRTCDVRIPDPAVSARHLVLEVEPGGVLVVEDAGSANGSTVGGRPLQGPVRVAPGEVVVVGDTQLEWRPGLAADAVLHPAAATIEVRRPPRLGAVEEGSVVEWPVEPVPPEAHRLPLASALVPLALGGLLFLVTHLLLTLLFVLMSPVMAVTSTVTDRRSGRRRHRDQMAAYRRDLAAAEDRLREGEAAEVAARRRRDPDPAAVAAVVSGPRRQLWERRSADADFLHLRVGLATLPSTLRRVRRGAFGVDEALPERQVAGVPCVVDLAAAGVLGVAGAPGVAGPLATWLVAQALVQSGPADLQLVVLSPGAAAGAARWGWSRWVPHAGGAEPGTAAAVATTAPAVEAAVRQLGEVVGQRRRAGEGHTRTAAASWPTILVVADPAHDVRGVPGMDEVLRHGPAVGVVAVCVEEDERFLPAECRTVVVADGAGRATVRRSGEGEVAVAADAVSPAWCASVGRSLAPLSDPEVRRAGGAIPTAVRLVDLLDIDPDRPETVVTAWSQEPRQTSVPVGLALDGAFRVDLRVDGPHGLVAGTTGAGKSEWLQTLVASLAVANRPDALTFLLVDYKGGSAFRECALLPHTVGVVTDLDGHLTERALTSLGAELKAREGRLAAAGTKDIDDYVEAGEPLGALPRLVIVIDEFAGLVAELPEFVAGLVGIAQRGRSLGIHLILATQRPSGVVSPEIRANTNLRVALRVTSPAESVDIVDAPDAATILPATPGRAYARTGHTALTLFQSARVGGPARGAAGPVSSLRVLPYPWAGRPAAGPAAGAEEAGGDTDLARIVAALTAGASALGIERQPRPWLPSLPPVLLLDDLPAAAQPATSDPATSDPAPGPSSEAGPLPGAGGPVPVGLVDLPARQTQVAWELDPAAPGHLLVAGSPGTGRTTFLRTVAGSLTDRHHWRDLWLYVFDCGGGELRRLAELPHCGAVVTRTETDRADRLLERLHAEMGRRLERLAAGGYADLGELRAAGQQVPYIVVLVDRWEGFMAGFDEIDGGRLTDRLLDLGREGGAAGIRLVVTGDRTVLLGKLAAMVDDRVCLSLAEASDYSLAGLDPRQVPPAMPPGRAVRTSDRAEVQVACLGAGPSGPAQAAAIAQRVERWRGAPTEGDAGLPFRVQALPAAVGWSEVVGAPWPRRPLWALLGVGGDDLAPVGVDLARAGGFVVCGPRRSGRSTVLGAMAASALEGGTAVLAFCPRSSPLRSLRGTPGVLDVVVGDDPDVGAVLEVLNAHEGPLVVLVDDAPLLHNAAVAELLEQIGRDGSEQGHAMVVAGTADELLRPMRGFIVEVRQARSGVLLCPESHLHGEVVGLRLPRSSVWHGPPGRGVLVQDAARTMVQVAEWLPPDQSLAAIPWSDAR